jgi:hypothetical protein
MWIKRHRPEQKVPWGAGPCLPWRPTSMAVPHITPHHHVKEIVVSCYCTIRSSYLSLASDSKLFVPIRSFQSICAPLPYPEKATGAHAERFEGQYTMCVCPDVETSGESIVEKDKVQRRLGGEK